jgi:histidyl-tRNA synthetase
LANWKVTLLPLIPPRTLKGFRDHLPESMLVREKMIDTVRSVYQSYGFAPIDTPALEYEEILIGKGGAETDKQLYRFEDHGGRRVGMRFDLTVPLARFAAQHIGNLGTPLKRYHIATVWRGENTQRGRYREFMQCDFDTIGTKSIAADIETALVIHDLMLAIGCDRFKIHVNNRKILTGILQTLGLQDQATAMLRSLDKLGKIGRQGVADEMLASKGITATQVDEVLALTDISGTNDQVLKQLAVLTANVPTAAEGTSQLAEILAALSSVGVPESRIHLNLSIARGLDYYTGTIFETYLDELPEIGSVCSGGRYDHLAEIYTNIELPGIGASLGLDRLQAAMQELVVVDKVATPAEVFIVYFDGERLHEYLKLAKQLRSAGLRVELYAESKKISQQLKYADRRGHQVAIVAGRREFESDSCQLKNLRSGDSQEVSLSDGTNQLVAAIRRQLAR